MPPARAMARCTTRDARRRSKPNSIARGRPVPIQGGHCFAG